MGLARAVGYPNYSADGSSRFIPEMWSGKLLEKFYDATENRVENVEKNVGRIPWILIGMIVNIGLTILTLMMKR